MKHLICLLLVFSLVTAASIGRATEPLRLVRKIPLANVAGRIDHLAADTDGHRLFVAALGNNTVEVIDLAAGKVIESIRGLHEPQGVAFLKEAGIIAVASGGDGTCRLFDSKSFRLRNTIDLQSDADNVRFDPRENRLYVGFGMGAIADIDVASKVRVGDIKLAGHPESFQLETKGNRIFVNVPEARQVAVIDRKLGKVEATWPVAKAQANFAMALDEASHRLFIGCRSPAKVLVYDTATGKVPSSFPTVGDTDDLFYDSRVGRLYVCGGEGFIFVHQKENGDHFIQMAKIPTAAGARTALFVPTMSRLFVAVPHRGSLAAELREYEVAP
jgi:YVTN family beta-propeller protein